MSISLPKRPSILALLRAGGIIYIEEHGVTITRGRAAGRFFINVEINRGEIDLDETRFFSFNTAGEEAAVQFIVATVNLPF